MRRLGVVAIVVVGLSAVVRAVSMLATNSFAFSMLFEDPSSWTQVIGFVVWSVLLLAFGFWLVIKRRYVAESLFDDDDVGIAGDPVALLRIALLVMGIMFVMQGVLGFVSAIGQSTWRQAMEQQFGAEIALSPGAEWGGGLSIVLALVQLAVGAFMLKSSRPLAQRLLSGRVVEAPDETCLPACPSCGAHYDPDDYRDMSTARCVECGSPIAPPGV